MVREQQLFNLLNAVRYWIGRRELAINLHKKLNSIEQTLDNLEAKICKIDPNFSWAKYQFEIKLEEYKGAEK